MLARAYYEYVVVVRVQNRQESFFPDAPVTRLPHRVDALSQAGGFIPGRSAGGKRRSESNRFRSYPRRLIRLGHV